MRVPRTLRIDAAKLKMKRLTAGFTQSGFARHLRQRFLKGLERTTLSLRTLKRMERGEPVLADNAAVVASALGMELSELLSSVGGTDVSTLSQASQPPAGERTGHAADVVLTNPIAVRMWCEIEYGKLLIDDVLRVVHGELDEPQYWQRFWHHQRRQYYFWRDGLIAWDCYRRWLQARRNEHDRNERLISVTYREAWKSTRAWLADETFSRFIEEVFASGPERAAKDPAPPSEMPARSSAR